MNNCIILALVIVSFVYPIQGLGGGFQHNKFKKFIISTYNKRYLVNLENEEKSDPNIGAGNDINDYGQDYDPEIFPDVIPPPLPPGPQDQPGSNGPCSGNLEFGWAYPSKKTMNNDLNWGATDKKNSPQKCQAHCKRFARCVGFTWVDGLNNCWLKYNMAAHFRDNSGPGFISGRKNTCISPAPWPLRSCGSKNICPGAPKVRPRPQPIESDPVGYKSCIMKCKKKYKHKSLVAARSKKKCKNRLKCKKKYKHKSIVAARSKKKCKNRCKKKYIRKNWKGAPNPQVLPQPQPIKGDPEVRPQPRPIKGDSEVRPRPRPIKGDPEVRPRPRPIKGDPEVRPRPIKGDPEVRPRPIKADPEFGK